MNGARRLGSYSFLCVNWMCRHIPLRWQLMRSSLSLWRLCVPRLCNGNDIVKWIEPSPLDWLEMMWLSIKLNVHFPNAEFCMANYCISSKCVCLHNLTTTSDVIIEKSIIYKRSTQQIWVVCCVRTATAGSITDWQNVCDRFHMFVSLAHPSVLCALWLMWHCKQLKNSVNRTQPYNDKRNNTFNLFIFRLFVFSFLLHFARPAHRELLQFMQK